MGAPIVIAWADLAALSGFGDQLDLIERSRAMLRSLASRHLGVHVDDVQITARCPDCGGPHGQPTVVSAPHVGLSLARTDGRVLAAVGACPVGIDVEAITRSAFDGVEQVALTAPELDLLARTPRADHAELVARMWVRKEALLKLHGCGLRQDPATVSSGLAELNASATFVELNLGPGYAAAVATAAPAPIELIAATELLSRTATA